MLCELAAARHLSAADNVEFENTKLYLGQGKKYSRVHVAGRGPDLPGYDLNTPMRMRRLCLVRKMKEHAGHGVTLSMKNVYGATPITIYGEGAGVTNRAFGLTAGAAESFTLRPHALKERATAERPQPAQRCRIPDSRTTQSCSSARLLFSTWSTKILRRCEDRNCAETNYGSPKAGPRQEHISGC